MNLLEPLNTFQPSEEKANKAIITGKKISNLLYGEG